MAGAPLGHLVCFLSTSCKPRIPDSPKKGKMTFSSSEVWGLPRQHLPRSLVFIFSVLTPAPKALYGPEMREPAKSLKDLTTSMTTFSHCKSQLLKRTSSCFAQERNIAGAGSRFKAGDIPITIFKEFER